jgi:heme O synthase-like polyprenyltransferase
LKPRRAVITFFVVVFTVAAVFLLYEGATSGNYALIAVVLVAYVFVLMAEAYLSLRTRQQLTK